MDRFQGINNRKPWSGLPRGGGEADGTDIEKIVVEFNSRDIEGGGPVTS